MIIIAVRLLIVLSVFGHGAGLVMAQEPADPWMSGQQTCMTEHFLVKLQTRATSQVRESPVTISLESLSGSSVDTMEASGQVNLLSGTKASITLAPVSYDRAAGSNKLVGTGKFAYSPNLAMDVGLSLRDVAIQPIRFTPFRKHPQNMICPNAPIE